MRSHTCFWLLEFPGIQELLDKSMRKDCLDEVRVPVLVFDYPRHSGATDEGMTHRVLNFGLPSLKPRCKPIEGTIKAHKHSRLARPRSHDLTYAARTRRSRFNQTRTPLGFVFRLYL
jgi:hypothetical protein